MNVVANGTAHNTPKDLTAALLSSHEALVSWQNITPLARNEWICWVVSVKQQSTRDKHVKRAIQDLTRGKRRPCCWLGCTHRTDKRLSPSQAFFASKHNN